jgi:hypothetical protein
MQIQKGLEFFNKDVAQLCPQLPPQSGISVVPRATACQPLSLADLGGWVLDTIP